ncbi:MAG: hypothetical protein MN733_20865 [Nitrososphaera sp.]|nr:hypothetical protein [Nitrososphaera sp.]
MIDMTTQELARRIEEHDITPREGHTVIADLRRRMFLSWHMPTYATTDECSPSLVRYAKPSTEKIEALIVEIQNQLTSSNERIASLIAAIRQSSLTLIGVDNMSPDVPAILGTTGMKVLTSVVFQAKEAASMNQWPLVGVDVRSENDPEIEDSDFIMVVLKLRTSFEVADRILKDFYPIIEAFFNELGEVEKEVFVNKIYFDVETLA